MFTTAIAMLISISFAAVDSNAFSLFGEEATGGTSATSEQSSTIAEPSTAPSTEAPVEAPKPSEESTEQKPQ